MDYYYLIIVKFLTGFFIVIFYLNLSGKTQLSQLTPVDFVGNFVLGGIIGGVIYDNNISIHQYIFVLLIGILIIFCFNFFTKHFISFRSFTSGNTIPIIKNKKLLIANILAKKNKIDILNIISQLRVRGIYSFADIVYAQIEPDGQITVSCDKNHIPGEIIIYNGQIRTNALDHIAHNETWLNRQLKQAKIKQKDVFILEFHSHKLLFILTDGKTKSFPIHHNSPLKPEN